MTRTLIAVVALTLAGCAALQDSDPYDPPPFYVQFLNTGSELDWQIAGVIDEIRANPDSPILHNRLGQLLVHKKFPKDAAREFERAINLDSSFYPAWYNLGLVRASLGDESGARRAFARAVNYRKGHGPALFQLGLMAEKAGENEEAVAYYAKALHHNPELLNVRINPRVLDSKLMHRALLDLYPMQHARESGIFQAAPTGYTPVDHEAPSDVESPAEIVTPAAPVTDQGTQTPPPPPGQ
jgi:tetratricopeptide (TPR) repeat protein